MDVLIRDLPDELHAELVRRAAAKDTSLRAYLHDVLSEHVALPSMQEWLEQVSALGPANADMYSGADVVAAARDEDDELVSR